MEKLTTTYEATQFYLTFYPFLFVIAVVAFIDLGLNAQQFNLIYVNSLYTNVETSIPDFITLDTWVAIIDVGIGAIVIFLMITFFIRILKKIYTFMLNVLLILALITLISIRIWLGYKVYYFDQNHSLGTSPQQVDITMFQTYQNFFLSQILTNQISQVWLNYNAMFNSYFNFWYISAVTMAICIASLPFIVLMIIKFGKLMLLWFLNPEDNQMFLSDEEDKKSLLSAAQKQGSSMDLINR